MAALLTIPELALLSRETIDPDDPYATWIINAASLIVCETAGHPEWTISGTTAAPERARIIASQLAKRTYLNPDAERSYNTGPIGGVTIEDFARTLELTPVEEEYLEGIKHAEAGGDPAEGVIFMLGTHNRRPGVARTSDVLFDDSGSALLYGEA